LTADIDQGHPDETTRLRAELEAAKAEISALRKGAKPNSTQPLFELYRDAFHQAGTGILVLDPQARITEVNQHCLDILGYSREELLGKHPKDYTHADDIHANLEQLLQVQNRESAGYRVDKRVRHKNGSHIWMEFTVRGIFGPGGELCGYVGIAADITARRNSEKTVWENEKRLRSLVEQLPVLIHAHDAQGNYVFWNRECERVLGYKAEEIIGNPNARALFFPDPERRREIDRLHEPDTVFDTVEAKTLAADGSTRTILWTHVMGDQPMPGWSAWETGIDITDLKATENALRASEQEKQIILDTISECVLYQTPQKRILWANRAASALAGLNKEGIRGLRCFEVWHGYKKSCMSQICPVERALELREPVEAEVEGEGGRTWLVKGYPVINSKGEVSGAIEVARDITDRKRTEIEIRKARDMAENATKMKDEFLANMSHELRSPLNGVLGMLDVLLDTKLDAEQRDCIETALQAGEGLLAIINDILDFSKLQADKISLSHNDLNLHTTVRTVCNTFREQSRRKGLDVSFTLDESVPQTVIGDEGRIRQILFNLVGNSVKFTREGSVKVECFLLRKGADPMRARLLFIVTDTGIGIPPDQLDTIFDPFVQLNWAKHRKYEGTGLGLGIVKRLVTLMGGIITVESALGSGTTINFWVNVALPETPA